jgi:hypothetical protein
MRRAGHSTSHDPFRDYANFCGGYTNVWVASASPRSVLAMKKQIMVYYSFNMESAVNSKWEKGGLNLYASGSQIVLRGSQGVLDQFPGNPHSLYMPVMAILKFILFN